MGPKLKLLKITWQVWFKLLSLRMSFQLKEEILDTADGYIGCVQKLDTADKCLPYLAGAFFAMLCTSPLV